MPNWSSLVADKKNELIRKTTDALVAYAARTVALPTAFTTYAAGPPATISLNALPASWELLGHLNTDGIQLGREVAQSVINSLGQAQPTRTDISSDTTTCTVVCQETNAHTIAIASGVDLAALDPATDSGELIIDKPLAPQPRAYRLLALAFDRNPTTGGEIIIGRLLPNAKVTSFAQQTLQSGDTAIEWGVTFTAEVDSTAGYSERWIFGGAGWNSLLTDMGFTP